MYFSQSQNWRAVKPLNQTLTRFEIFHFKIMLFKKEPKMQIKSFSRSKINQNVVFCMQTFFQKMICPKFFNSKSNAMYFFQFKIWRFVKLFIRNLKRFEIFISKSGALEKPNSKSDKFWIFFLRSLIFIWFFGFWLNDDIFCQR